MIFGKISSNIFLGRKTKKYNQILERVCNDRRFRTFSFSNFLFCRTIFKNRLCILMLSQNKWIEKTILRNRSNIFLQNIHPPIEANPNHEYIYFFWNSFFLLSQDPQKHILQLWDFKTLHFKLHFWCSTYHSLQVRRLRHVPAGHPHLSLRARWSSVCPPRNRTSCWTSSWNKWILKTS